ncbi:ATP F0F1 synthase subunit B [Phenylobacterium sp.]|jgi:F-type H+-transporting ATPase subunit b|uniref:F0F1 ATP synthase subunit B family protein n=1 Tax=Phenylobacterium sp. TaxID=1871053 RepID=UPI002F92F5A9
MPAFLNPAEAEAWVGAGLLIFLAIVIFVAKAPKTVAGILDAKAQSIQSDLDEAARIRQEAERLLAELRAERAKAEADAKAMLDQAQIQARAYEADAKAKLEESLKRRQEMTERKIAEAERRAMDDVRAAAADLAVQMAEQVLAGRRAAMSNDPLVDRAIGQLAAKLQ